MYHFSTLQRILKYHPFIWYYFSNSTTVQSVKRKEEQKMNPKLFVAICKLDR